MLAGLSNDLNNRKATSPSTNGQSSIYFAPFTRRATVSFRDLGSDQNKSDFCMLLAGPLLSCFSVRVFLKLEYIHTVDHSFPNSSCRMQHLMILV